MTRRFANPGRVSAGANASSQTARKLRRANEGMTHYPYGGPHGKHRIAQEARRGARPDGGARPERARILRRASDHQIIVMVGVAPDKPEDITDIERAILACESSIETARSSLARSANAATGARRAPREKTVLTGGPLHTRPDWPASPSRRGGRPWPRRRCRPVPPDGPTGTTQHAASNRPDPTPRGAGTPEIAQIGRVAGRAAPTTRSPAPTAMVISAMLIVAE